MIPVYNVEEYIEECIESVVNQSYDNLEIVLVDDASTDKSAEICDKYSALDRRIKVIHKPTHTGVSDSRNIGIENISCEYVYLIDSDDFICNKNTLERMYNLLTEDVDIVLAYYYEKRIDGNFYLNTNNDQEYSELTPIEAINNIYNTRKYKYNFTVPHNKLYRKDLFKHIKYPFGKIHEDEFITYKLYLKSRKIVVLNDVTYAYRIRQGSIMNSLYNIEKLSIFESYKERIQILEEIKEFDLSKKTKQLYFYNLLFHKYMLLKSGAKEYCDIRKEYKNFMKNNPKYHFGILKYKFLFKELLFKIFGI